MGYMIKGLLAEGGGHALLDGIQATVIGHADEQGIVVRIAVLSGKPTSVVAEVHVLAIEGDELAFDDIEMGGKLCIGDRGTFDAVLRGVSLKIWKASPLAFALL